MLSKFGKKDRNLVIQEMERIYTTKLSPVISSSKKLFSDSKGKYYYICGGKGDWHGIRQNIMTELLHYKQEGVFAIVNKYESRMDIYVGSLQKLIQNVDKLRINCEDDYQFETVLTNDIMHLSVIPDLYLEKVSEIPFSNYHKDLTKYESTAKIINVEDGIKKEELSHYDLQAKLVLIGNYLSYRTYVAERDKGRNTIFGKTLGELCSEANIPVGSIPALSQDTIKSVDVIWFDEEGYPTHAFEVDHTGDITEGLLHLYQIHKLKIKMFIISNQHDKFNKEVNKSPFIKIKEEFIFRNYNELNIFFENAKIFTKIKEEFLQDRGFVVGGIPPREAH